MFYGVQIDLARQLERPERLKAKFEKLPEYGCEVCVLYLEDAYLYESMPEISRENAFSPGTMKALQELLIKNGITLVPVIPALGHCKYITSKKGFEKYDEGYGSGEPLYTLKAGKPETYCLISRLFRDWADHIPGAYIHAGLDESPAMGQSFIREHGRENFDSSAMFACHCNKVNEIIKSLGRRMIIWSDMLHYFPRAAEMLERDIVIQDWYYYSFDDVPKVELYNFKPADLALKLRAMGFEVWGTSSVWPNMPFPNLKDRLANFRSWVDYGKSRRLNGVILSDWENTCGFYDISDFIFKAFGKLKATAFRHSLEDVLRDTTLAEFGFLPQDDFIKGLLELGRYHFCGEGRPSALKKHPLSMVSADPERIEECRHKSGNTEKLFPGIEKLIESAGSETASDFITAAKLCRDMTFLYWNSAYVLSLAYTNIRARDDIHGLYEKLRLFLSDYRTFWNRVRFGDGKISAIEWAENMSNLLKSLIDGYKPDRGFKDTALFKKPRLEMVLECRFPALPVLSVIFKYADGTSEKFRVVMIKFESEYAVTEKIWRQYPTIVPERNDMPMEIEFVSTHYGQTAIISVRFIKNGTETLFRLKKVSGENIRLKNKILILGPRCAREGDLTHRTEPDSAVFVPKLSAQAGNSNSPSS